jgi:hypothetical protein
MIKIRRWKPGIFAQRTGKEIGEPGINRELHLVITVSGAVRCPRATRIMVDARPFDTTTPWAGDIDEGHLDEIVDPTKMVGHGGGGS